MPEGPEVKIMAEYLNNLLAGGFLYKIIINPSSKFAKYPINGLDKLNSYLPLRITKISSFGKKIIFFLSHNVFLISSLGMEGRWTINEESHSQLNLIVSSGTDEKFDLFYDDSRHFGNINLAFSVSQVTSLFDKIGLDPFHNKIPFDVWKSRIASQPRKKIANVLIDQSLIAGIGNYLRSEICHMAKINPCRVVSTLTDEELEELRISTLSIMQTSYVSGGFTLKTFHSPDGHIGRYQTRVYGRDVDDFGNSVSKMRSDDKRVLYWVPNIQH